MELTASPTPYPLENSPESSSGHGLHYMWQNKRWLLIAIAAGIIIVLLAIALIVVLILGQSTPSNSAAKPTPTQAQASQPPATRESADNAFFASKPLTILYYSFAQTSNIKSMYQATPDDSENRVLDIGFPDKYNFGTSPDGAWLIRWNKSKIEKANTAAPAQFSSLYAAAGNDTEITSVIWQANSTTIAIATQKTQADATGNHATSMYVLPLLTMQPVAIMETKSAAQHQLIAFPSDTELYFVEDKNGSPQNLTLFNPQNKQVERQLPSLNQNSLLTQLKFSRDMRWGYRTNGTEVIRYNLQTMEQTSIYQINRQCAMSKNNDSRITSVSISPSGSTLLIHEELKQCSYQTREEEAKAVHSNRLFTYATDQRKVIEETFDTPLTLIQQTLWAPKEDFIWITADTQHAYSLGRNTMQLNQVPTSQRQNLTKERVFPIGWMVAKK